MHATYQKYLLSFKKPAVTSRGVLLYKETYLLKIIDGSKVGIGECALFRGLSVDDTPEYETQLQWLCRHITMGEAALKVHFYQYPSIVFGLEQAFLSLRSTTNRLFENDFTLKGKGIPINGLIWMGSIEDMRSQVEQKIKMGFSTIKIKVGALDFNLELQLLKELRMRYPKEQITFRLDANGAFLPKDALRKLHLLSELSLHSIEQPIAPKYVSKLASLCTESPVPIALDESLIGVFGQSKQRALLEEIRPHYIILKPSLIGGFSGAQSWIAEADRLGIPYWITSALESNVGLSGIAQWTASLHSDMPQGLGTGGLFVPNFPSNLFIKNGYLCYQNQL